MRPSLLAAVTAIALAPGLAPAREVLGQQIPDTNPPTRTVRVVWQRQLVDWDLLVYAPRSPSGPAIDEFSGDVVVGTRDGHVRALTAEGRELWWTRLPEPTSSPVLTEERVIVGCADGALHALDRFTGQEIWKSYLGGEVLEPPVVAGDLVFAGTDHDSVHALAVADGTVRWAYRREPSTGLTIRGGAGPAVGGGRVYAGFSDGLMVALAPEDGRVLWEQRLATSRPGTFADIDTVPVFHDGAVFVTSYDSGVFALDAATGTKRWNHELRGAGALALGGQLYVGGATSAVALDPDGGRRLWAIDLHEAPVGQPVLTPDVVVFPSGRGLLFASRRTGRPLSTWDPGSGFTAPPAASGSTLYAISNRGVLYKLSLTTEVAAR